MFKLTSSDEEHELGLDSGVGARYETCCEDDNTDAWAFYNVDSGPELPADLEGLEDLF